MPHHPTSRCLMCLGLMGSAGLQGVMKRSWAIDFTRSGSYRRAAYGGRASPWLGVVLSLILSSISCKGLMSI